MLPVCLFFTPQKNWAPYVDGDNVLLVQFINPLKIYKYFPRTNDLSLWSSQELCKTDLKIRGGTQLVKIDNMLIGIGHTKSLCDGFKHVVYIIDYISKKLVSHSNEFVFDKLNFRVDLQPIIEFASGMVKLN